MKIKEIRKLDEKQLVVQLHEARVELAKERAASEIGTVKNPGRIRAVRKTIARIQTIVSAKNNATKDVKNVVVKSPAKSAGAEKTVKK